jgi:hydroxymethylpyrimidine/phosphomethylpyrimidine kinase
MKKRAGGAASRPTVVSIASSDSGGGAGIQADLLTFAAHGVHGATVVVAGTAQNTRGVRSVEPFSVGFLTRQLDAVFEDLSPRAVKIGMLFDTTRIRAVARGLDRHRARNVVLDPVLVSTSGARLLSRSAIETLRRELLPRCNLVTPNLPEAETLARMRIRSDGDRRLAAGVLADLGAPAVLIKGGHGHGPESRDLLFDGRFFTEFAAPRLRTRATHGTGCTLSAAIAANLALGWRLEDAVLRAIAYLRAGLERGYFPGRGRGVPERFPPGYRTK